MTLKEIPTYIKYFLSVIALITVIQGAFVKGVTIVYHQELEDFQDLKMYKEKSDSTIKYLTVEVSKLQRWKKVKSATKAIGLRKNIVTNELWYRAGGDLLLYRAYYDQYHSAYFYNYNGTQFECH